MSFNGKKIFIGGYTKSGTTFVGRVFGLLNGVYAHGEEDYFRLVMPKVNELINEFNYNIGYVNREVYDDQGPIPQVTNQSGKLLHQKIFYHLFFGGQDIPEDCIATVEKSPRNAFYMAQIKFLFPDAQILCVYRDPIPVFASLMRHMADHRSPNYRDPDSEERRESLENFLVRWNAFCDTLEKRRELYIPIRYENVVADKAGFVDFIQKEMLQEDVGLSEPLEHLSKEYYLSTLPPEKRATSLVQIDPARKIQLSEREQEAIKETCIIPSLDFAF